MKTVGATEFQERCLAILDRRDVEGIVIAKHGKPVAQLVPIGRAPAELIGALAATCASRETFSPPVWSGTALPNLDTHILVFALGGDVPDAERETLASGWVFRPIRPGGWFRSPDPGVTHIAAPATSGPLCEPDVAMATSGAAAASPWMRPSTHRRIRAARMSGSCGTPSIAARWSGSRR